MRLLLKTKNEIDSEKVSYVQNLDYNFSAEVDSIATVGKKGRGFLVCTLTQGHVNPKAEDHLNEQLTHYEWMRFLFFKPNGQLQIFLNNIINYRSGDSVSVNSGNDRLAIYRNGNVIFESAITHATWQKVSYSLW